MDKAAQYLGLARKGGMLAVGEEGSGAVIAAGRGRLLMLAADASPNARKRAEGFLYGHRAPLQTLPWTKAELSAMMNFPPVLSAISRRDSSLASPSPTT